MSELDCGCVQRDEENVLGEFWVIIEAGGEINSIARVARCETSLGTSSRFFFLG